MAIDPNQIFVTGLFEEAVARTGFSAAELKELLECELNIEDLLSYIDATTSNRMN